jgi:prolyl-tRNA synthetase
MRYTRTLIPTQKEAPKDATMPSHKFLLRGGYARMVGAGLYEFLPLGMRVLQKISAIVREEMDGAGALEVLMPTLLPAEYFRETGRYEAYGATLLRLKDRKGGEYHLGPTHEEIVTDMVRREVKSYRQLPMNIYQIQLKYRDEPRPRAGLLRCREFIMKDAYSFDVDKEHALKSYEHMREAYHRIFKRLGLEYRVVTADSGAIGGDTSAEFQVLAQTGEDALVACEKCDYAANVEAAETKLPPPASSGAALSAVETVDTPGKHSIDDVVAFLGNGLTAEQTLKSLVYWDGKEAVVAVVRGDHQINEVKLARALGVAEITLASDTQVRDVSGADPGFVGPVGLKKAARILVDPAAAAVRNAVTGANQKDKHLRGVNYGRDFGPGIGEHKVSEADLREVTEGDPCPKCSAPLKAYRGIEGGHIFVLGTHYSGKMNATFLDQNGAQVPFVMGCYGIGVSRLVAATIEQNHDDGGIRWPMSVAPYHVVLLPMGKDDDAKNAAEKLYAELTAAGVDVLLDDRDERPGVKFNDADLIGIPLRVTIGSRGLKEGAFELKRRTEKEPVMIPIADAVKLLVAEVRTNGGRLRA